MSRQYMRHLQGLEDFEDFKYILPQQFTLNNGVEMPAIGLDTFKMGHFYTVLQTVDDALKTGYRMFDTAALYGNEVYLNLAFKKLLPKYKLKRGDIFIISKLLPCNYGGGAVTERAFHNTLSNLGLDYIDLYLVHNPGIYKLDFENRNSSRIRKQTWATLVDLYHDHKIRALGVSNYFIWDLMELMDDNQGVVPAVNQVEWQPYCRHLGMYHYCKENNIVLQAFSPLGGDSSEILLNDQTVLRIAENLGVTPAQVLLVWSLQQHISVIPKSVNPDRLKENITLRFNLSTEDIEDLNALSAINIRFS